MRCRTVDQAFAAGWNDAEDDAPLTTSEVAALVALHARYLNRDGRSEVAA